MPIPLREGAVIYSRAGIPSQSSMLAGPRRGYTWSITNLQFSSRSEGITVQQYFYAVYLNGIQIAQSDTLRLVVENNWQVSYFLPINVDLTVQPQDNVLVEVQLLQADPSPTFIQTFVTVFGQVRSNRE